MPKVTFQRVLVLLVGLGLAAGIVSALVPRAVPVELVTASVGPLRVTVEGEGKTRVIDRFVVSAPLPGNLPRIELRPGDKVALGAPLARLSPLEPPLLDERARAEADAQVQVARAALSQAEARVAVARTSSEHAQTELGRTRTLVAGGGLPTAQLDDAEVTARLDDQEVSSAKFGVQVARYQLDNAEAAVARAKGGSGSERGAVPVRSPVNGRVLRVLQESAGVVQAGAALLELGDPTALEVVVDLLSTDAVRVKPGAEVSIEHWGGDAPLKGRVRLVEPSGFTKVSSLGIEEQRVNVVVDFVGPPEDRAALGDGYRVDARIVVWEAASVLEVPVSALFREGERWSVLVAEGGKAHLRGVDLGKRNDEEAAVLGGLSAGEKVVAHPGDKVTDGTRIAGR
jgi:HlyD family secretion protein